MEHAVDNEVPFPLLLTFPESLRLLAYDGRGEEYFPLLARIGECEHVRRFVHPPVLFIYLP